MKKGGQQRTQRILLIAIAFTVVASAVTFLATRPNSDELLPVAPVLQAKARPMLALETAPDMIGVVVPRQSSEVASRIQGRILTLHVALGEPVKKAQLVAKLDEGTLPAQIDFAKAAISSARSSRKRAGIRLEGAESKSRRRADLGEAGVAGTEEVEEANTAAGIARANRQTASVGITLRKSELSQLEQELAETEIRAPFDGVVAHVYEAEGNVVSVGAPLFRVNSTELWVRFAGPPELMATLEEGKIVALVEDNEGWYAGEETAKGLVKATIRNIAPAIDPASELVIAEATIQLSELQKHSLRPGTVVEVAPIDTLLAR